MPKEGLELEKIPNSEFRPYFKGRNGQNKQVFKFCRISEFRILNIENSAVLQKIQPQYDGIPIKF
jgi:hypothetical protein